MQGSQHNDAFILEKKEGQTEEESKLTEPLKLSTKTNNAGGTLGGISSGENIVINKVFLFIKLFSTSKLPLSLFQLLV